MSEVQAGGDPAVRDGEEISLLSLANILLRWRRLTLWLGLSGAIVGLTSGLLTTRLYVSSATFVPQATEGTSGLAAAASLFIGQGPTSVGAWGPAVYVELLSSRTLLESVVAESLVVVEKGGRHMAFADLLEIKAPTSTLRSDAVIRAFRGMIKVNEVKPIGIVRLAVATPWPSVSLTLAERLVEGVNNFNLKTRNSQAAAERRFVEAQAAEAERVLHQAEDRLQLFLQRNRATGNSPELIFEHDRLTRDVGLRQQLYLSLLQNQESARIREVRDTPVITVLESANLPILGEPRGSINKAILGGILGIMLGAFIAFFAHGLAVVRRWPGSDVQEFFHLVAEATPRVLKGKNH